MIQVCTEICLDASVCYAHLWGTGVTYKYLVYACCMSLFVDVGRPVYVTMSVCLYVCLCIYIYYVYVRIYLCLRGSPALLWVGLTVQGDFKGC